MAQMATADINDLPDSDFAYIEGGGSKDSSGKTVPRSLRHFPIHDAAHVRNALARAPQSPFGSKAMPKIEAAAKKFGVDTGGDSSRSTPYFRSFALEDITVRSDGGGRTVDAYAAVFDTPANCSDYDGEYSEVIDPGCFNRAIEHATRSGRKFPILFNHGMTLFHTPSERDSAPIGVAEEVKADRRGVFTRARYHNTPRADEVLEGIRDGSITGYSFTGMFLKSTPAPPRGGFRRGRDGSLPTVRRMESTLREFGPVTFPVYQDASIMGVRAEQMAYMLGSLPPHELERLRGLLGTPGLPGPAADDPPDEGHSTRSNRATILARGAAILNIKD